MKRYGFAIKTGGDPEISAALAAGIDQATASSLHRQSSEAVRRVAMMRHTPEEWAEMLEDAQYEYRVRPVGRALGAVLGVWALVWSVLIGMTDALTERRAS